MEMDNAVPCTWCHCLGISDLSDQGYSRASNTAPPSLLKKFGKRMHWLIKWVEITMSYSSKKRKKKNWAYAHILCTNISGLLCNHERRMQRSDEATAACMYPTCFYLHCTSESHVYNELPKTKGPVILVSLILLHSSVYAVLRAGMERMDVRSLFRSTVSSCPLSRRSAEIPATSESCNAL